MLASREEYNQEHSDASFGCQGPEEFTAKQAGDTLKKGIDPAPNT
jgi:hypothetical protein